MLVITGVEEEKRFDSGLQTYLVENWISCLP